MIVHERARIWHGSEWTDYQREWNVEDRQQIAQVLARRHDRDVNEFWLSHEGREFPHMAIEVAGDLACVHYWPCDGHAGWRLLGGFPGLDPDGSTEFQICGEYDATPNEFVVPFSAALDAAAAFLNDTRMPAVGDWFEL